MSFVVGRLPCASGEEAPGDPSLTDALPASPGANQPRQEYQSDRVNHDLGSVPVEKSEPTSLSVPKWLSEPNTPSVPECASLKPPSVSAPKAASE